MGEARLALQEREIINRRLLELSSIDQEPLQFWVNYASVLLRVGRAQDAMAHARQRAAQSPRNRQHLCSLQHAVRPRRHAAGASTGATKPKPR